MSDELTRATVLDRVQRAVRGIADGDRGDEYVDRLVLAAVLVAGAAAVAWPEQRAVPRIVARGAQLLAAVWKRRSLWLDAPVPAR